MGRGQPQSGGLTSCALQGGPSGCDHVVLTGPTGPEELWELVWEHGARVLVSLCPPDVQEKVRGTGDRGWDVSGVEVGCDWAGRGYLAEQPCLVPATGVLAHREAPHHHKRGDCELGG